MKTWICSITVNGTLYKYVTCNIYQNLQLTISPKTVDCSLKHLANLDLKIKKIIASNPSVFSPFNTTINVVQQQETPIWMLHHLHLFVLKKEEPRPPEDPRKKSDQNTTIIEQKSFDPKHIASMFWCCHKKMFVCVNTNNK